MAKSQSKTLVLLVNRIGNMGKKLIYFLLLSLFMLACSPKAAMYRQNLDFVYAPESTIQYDLRRENDSLHVYLWFADESLFKHIPASELKLTYLLNRSYEQEEIIHRDTVANFSKQLRVAEKFATADFRISLSKITLPVILQLQLNQPDEEQDRHWVDIPLTKESTAKTFILTNADGLPLFRTHVNTAESFWIKAIGADKIITVKQYEAAFPAALPPFSLSRNSVSPSLRLISTEQLPVTAPVNLSEAGLYVLELNQGRTTVVAEGNAYPELTTARELIEPLIYITSAKEREELYDAPEPKRALDQFWLDIARQDETLARNLIRIYYDRVKEANQFFGSHKAGWLTDRGMLYIVFGKPDVVNRRQQTEEWTYTRRKQGGSVLKFVFIKKPNTFTQNHYELIRHPDYEFVWYSTVEKWRKGITQEE